MYACYSSYRKTCSIQWYFVCANNLYTFLIGDTVKRYTVDNIIVEKLIQSSVSRTIRKCCKCLIKYVSCYILLALPAIFAISVSCPYS